MNFFKSVFSDTPPSSPPQSPKNPQSETLISDTLPDSPSSSSSSPAAESDSVFGGGTGGWSFGGLIQTLSTKSESVLETYRRDLQEFSTGLKNETQVLKHVAATSLDVGAAKAQVSLESVGNAIDSLGSVVSEIIFHGGDSSSSPPTENQPLVARDVGVKYSRFEAQLMAIQTDEKTFTEEPVEEGEKGEFEKWKLGFDLGDYADEIDELLGRKESGIKAVFDRVVPSLVDQETFWLRYFYRVNRLKQAEFVRARLVKRAIEADDDEEELSWDVDDDDNDNVNVNVNENDTKDDLNVLAANVAENVSLKDEKPSVEGTSNEKPSVEGTSTEKPSVEGAITEKPSVETEDENRVVNKNVVSLVEEKGSEVGDGKGKASEASKDSEVGEGKGEASEASKDSDISVVSSQPSSHEEEDMGWDEIEDVGSDDDEKKGSSRSPGSPSRLELRKRLSVAEDDEDLSWDIEDDDEPMKA